MYKYKNVVLYDCRGSAEAGTDSADPTTVTITNKYFAQPYQTVQFNKLWYVPQQILLDFFN